MKIIDAFIFYNELDMLYYRLSVLYDIVDYFIIVEATRTHVGNSKPLYYETNKEMFSKFADKIIHVVDDELIENVYDPWVNEHHQRNHIYQGIKQLDLELNDKIIISDVDEIPDINALKNIKDTNQNFNILQFEQDMYYYNLTCKQVTKWYYPKIISYNTVINLLNCEVNRSRSFIAEGNISPGGWHLSYFGNPSFIRNKLEQFGHQEFNQDETYKNIEHIETQIKNCNDLFMRSDAHFIKIPISENSYLPPQYEKYLQNYLHP